MHILYVVLFYLRNLHIRISIPHLTNDIFWELDLGFCTLHKQGNCFSCMIKLENYSFGMIRCVAL